MKKVTNRNTKAEIIKLYNEVVKELKALKAQKSADPAPKALPPGPPDVEGGEMTVADIVARLKGLTSNIGDAASVLQGRLTGEVTALDELREEADSLIAELQSLHGIEVSDDSLDALIAQHVETSEAAEAELSEKREGFEKEMSTEGAAWQKEQSEHARAVKEAAAQIKKARQRDAQEYKYDTELSHKQEDDDRGQRQKHFAQELTELRESKVGQWSEREKQLAAREAEYAELKTKADAFEGELQAAVKKAEQEGTGVAKRQARIQADLKKKDNEGVQRVFELKIQDLEQTIAKQEQQIVELSRQLESARQQTTELAVKAIDGASNASSFESIKEIALEQAKNTQKGK